MNSSDFETHLKQLRPVTCDDRLAETFYHSGWQACAQSQAHQPAKQPSRRILPTFATGLVCGFMVSAVAFLWTPKTVAPAGRNIVEQPAAPSIEKNEGAEFGVKATVERMVAGHDDFESPTESNQHWRIEDLFVASPLLIEKPSPLSRAARQGWSSQMQASADLNRIRSAASPAATDSQQETPLTSSPFNSSVMQELML